MIRRIASCGLIIFFAAAGAIAEEENFKWKSISGKWRTFSDESGSFLIETKVKTIEWGYSELINYNSIVSVKPLEGVTALKISMRILNPVKPEVSMMIFFLVENYREFFAFRLSGNDGTFSRAEFISSKIKDSVKPPSVKWNFAVTDLEKGKCKIINNKEYKVDVAITGEKAVLFINGEKIIEGKADRSLGTGKFGFSGKNAALRIDDVQAYKDKDIIFEDDFSKDSVQRIVVKGTLEKIED